MGVLGGARVYSRRFELLVASAVAFLWFYFQGLLIHILSSFQLLFVGAKSAEKQALEAAEHVRYTLSCIIWERICDMWIEHLWSFCSPVLGVCIPMGCCRI